MLTDWCQNAKIFTQNTQSYDAMFSYLKYWYLIRHFWHLYFMICRNIAYRNFVDFNHIFFELLNPVCFPTLYIYSDLLANLIRIDLKSYVLCCSFYSVELKVRNVLTYISIHLISLASNFHCQFNAISFDSHTLKVGCLVDDHSQRLLELWLICFMICYFYH